jgi:hypothetical protein
MSVKPLFLGFAVLALGCTEQPVTTKAPEPIVGWVAIDPPTAPVTPPNMLGPIAITPDSLGALHRAAVQDFASIQNAFGGGRMVRFETRHGDVPNVAQWANKAGYHFGELDARIGPAVGWKIEQLQLVGFLQEPAGAAYEIPATVRATMETLKNFKTRPMNTFETDALALVREGKEAAAFIEHDRIRMLGAIRLTNDCKRCHQQPEGSIVGAFSYDLARDPEPFVKPAVPQAPVMP